MPQRTSSVLLKEKLERNTKAIFTILLFSNNKEGQRFQQLIHPHSLPDISSTKHRVCQCMYIILWFLDKSYQGYRYSDLTLPERGGERGDGGWRVKEIKRILSEVKKYDKFACLWRFWLTNSNLHVFPQICIMAENSFPILLGKVLIIFLVLIDQCANEKI